jgi:hypothetical protein
MDPRRVPGRNRTSLEYRALGAAGNCRLRKLHWTPVLPKRNYLTRELWILAWVSASDIEAARRLACNQSIAMWELTMYSHRCPERKHEVANTRKKSE